MVRLVIIAYVIITITIASTGAVTAIAVATGAARRDPGTLGALLGVSALLDAGMTSAIAGLATRRSSSA